jgi:hypothetical protein
MKDEMTSASFNEDQRAKVKQALKDLAKWRNTKLKAAEISEDERLVMGHQLDRVSAWCAQLADAIGYKLSH